MGQNIQRRNFIKQGLVASPDHWCALHTIYACQAGKDVYVENPIATSIAEGRAMVRAALKVDRFDILASDVSESHAGKLS